MHSDLWSMKFEAETMNSQLRIMKSEVWSLVFEVGTINCELGSITSNLSGYDIWSAKYELWECTLNCQVKQRTVTVK